MDCHIVPPMQKFAITPKWFELEIKKPIYKSHLLAFVQHIRSINSSFTYRGFRTASHDIQSP